MELDTILNLLIKYNLTADELLIVYLILIAQDEEGHKEFISKWYNHFGEEKAKAISDSLRKKGIITKTYEDEEFPNNIEFNKNFLKGWIKTSGQMGQELFSAYPKYLLINGKQMALTNFSKRFNTMEEMFFFYSLQIGHSIEKHKKIMEILDWAKKNNKLHYGIVEFIVGHKWEELDELKNSGVQQVEIGNTFDIYETV